MKRKLIVLACLFLIVTGCGLFDSGVIWKRGPYILGWIDNPKNVTVSYDLGGGTSIGRIDKCVFAVGWNGDFLVAKQHPNGDKRITNFYIIDVKKDNSSAGPEKAVTGPLTNAQYLEKNREMNLPKFSKVLESLK